MPIRFIKVPSPVTLHDPATRKPVLIGDKPVVWDFGTILDKLMGNPVWSETFASMRASQAVMDAYNPESPTMELAEEDWLKLKAAAETPRIQVETSQGPQLLPGLGVHPSVTRQLVPLLAPIIDATTSKGG